MTIEQRFYPEEWSEGFRKLANLLVREVATQPRNEFSTPESPRSERLTDVVDERGQLTIHSGMEHEGGRPYTCYGEADDDPVHIQQFGLLVLQYGKLPYPLHTVSEYNHLTTDGKVWQKVVSPWREHQDLNQPLHLLEEEEIVHLAVTLDAA
ncbi:MAG TPA: hypothetical protein VG992_05060 [Candidatus Saccharimonadales bacterium]|nr:hypothetical protein [Candidatus Saccharimonadales bacterium]